MFGVFLDVDIIAKDSYFILWLLLPNYSGYRVSNFQPTKLGMGSLVRPVLQVCEESQNKRAGLKRKSEQGSGGELKDPGGKRQVPGT